MVPISFHTRSKKIVEQLHRESSKLKWRQKHRSIATFPQFGRWNVRLRCRWSCSSINKSQNSSFTWVRLFICLSVFCFKRDESNEFSVHIHILIVRKHLCATYFALPMAGGHVGIWSWPRTVGNRIMSHHSALFSTRFRSFWPLDGPPWTLIRDEK